MLSPSVRTTKSMPGELVSFISELKRRNVLRIAVAYLIAARLIMLDNIFPTHDEIAAAIVESSK